MLKLFYKTLIVTLISGSLLLLDFSNKGSIFHINSVQAETVKLDSVKDADLMGTLVMTGVGLVSSRLFTCKMTTDMMLAAAGGAAFIAGEILATFELKKVMKDLEKEIIRDEKGKIDQKQFEIFEKLRKSYQEAKNTANTKKMLQMAAAAAFASAAVVAYMQYSTETAVLTTCNGALKSAGQACSMAFKASCSGRGTCVYPLQAGSMTANATVTPITNQSILALTPAMSAEKLAQDKALEKTNKASYNSACSQCPMACGASAPCEQIFTLNLATKGYCPAPLSLTDNVSVRKFIYAKAYTPMKPEVKSKNEIYNLLQTIFLSDAKADLFSPLGIASNAAISYVLETAKTLGMQIDMFLFSPLNRAITWGVLGTLTYAATSATDNQIQKIEVNISKIDAILNSMYALEKSVATANNDGVKNPNINKPNNYNKNYNLNDGKYQEIDLGANGSAIKLPCFTAEETSDCPSFSEKLNAQADLKSMPTFIQSEITDIGKFADGINGKSKISGSTQGFAQSLAGQQNALKAILKKQQKALQDKLIDSGNKIDLNREAAKLDANLKAAIKKGLDSRKTTAAAMYASFGGNSSGSGKATDASKNPPKAAPLDTTKGLVGGGIIAIPASTGMASGTDGIDAELEAKLAAEKKAAEEASANGDATASLDDYVLKNDITQDKDSSIFDLISNRYQKSYDKLFKRIK